MRTVSSISRRSVVLGFAAAGAVLAPGGQAFAEGGRRARARIRLTRDAIHVIEGNREHHLRDTVFEVAGDYPSRTVGLEIGDGARIDVLRVRVLPGVTDVDRFISLGAGARIGEIDVAAATQTDGSDERLDGFLQIRRPDIRIESIRFRNVDRCVLIYQAADVWIGSFDCTSYCKGVLILASEDVRIDRLAARKASLHAVPKPGYNGLTIGDSKRLRLPDVEVEDAAEHAIYLAGGGGTGYSEDIRFGKVVTRRSGQCGFKCKATRTPSVDVAIDELRVIDAAYRTRPGLNEDALRVENTHGFRIGRLEAACDTARRSCYAGIYLDGVTGFTLDGGRVDRPAGPMVLIEDRRGANAQIRITGLDGSRLQSHGYHVQLSRAGSVTDLVVAGGTLTGVAGDAVRIDAPAAPPSAAAAASPAAAEGSSSNIIDLEATGVEGELVRNATGDPGYQVSVTEPG